MDDFISDADMERLSSAPKPSQAAQEPQGGDFISDADMDALAPENAPQEAPTLSDAQMERMANPDHASVNAAIQKAINDGASKDQIIAMAQQYGVDTTKLAEALDPALAWRQRHGSYNGQVDVFRDNPDVRTQPRNEVSTLDAIGAGIGQGLTFGFGDEIGAGVGAIGNSVAGVFGGGTGEDFGDYYTRVRDENRAYLDDAEDQHGTAYTVGNVAGALPTAAIGGLGASGASLIGRAALEGAAYGAGQSEADTVAGVVGDSALGAAVGGATAGTLNRAGAVISPRVAPIVDKLMGLGVTMTPTQIMKAGGPVSRTVGKTVERIGRRGAITSEAMRGAEARTTASLDAAVARQDAAVAQARALGLNATPRHPDLIGDAERVIGKRAKETSQLEMLANILAGYSTGGSTLAVDAGLASLYTKPGAAVANGLLTGRQGPVPKSLRGIVEKTSPFAANAATANTPYQER